ncbi:MAG: LysM peptidoglycan-binding domain-containing protein [Anaerolineales bacterium]|nr:LysM peptidoglycan-binding domain-containing protein [Anaerolineales bacterium]
MKEWKQAMLGILMAALSGAVLFGSVLLSLAEGGFQSAMAPSLTAAAGEQEIMPTLIFVTPGGPTVIVTATSLPTLTPTPSCNYPSDWITIAILPGESLDNLASIYGTSPEALMAGNCLVVNSLVAGSELRVPPIQPTAQPTATRTLRPTATRAPVQCGRPYGWVTYIVRSGDTLFGLSLAFGVTVYDLQTANCMGTSTTIYTGQILYVPNVPTRTPWPTNTAYPTRTPQPTATGTAVPTDTEPPGTQDTPTSTATATQEEVDTATPTETPTFTVEPPSTTVAPPPPTDTEEPPAPADTLTPTTSTYP